MADAPKCCRRARQLPNEQDAIYGEADADTEGHKRYFRAGEGTDEPPREDGDAGGRES